MSDLTIRELRTRGGKVDPHRSHPYRSHRTQPLKRSRTALCMGIATVGFAVLHSLLASNAVKDAAAGVIGERKRDAGYRLLYNAQAVTSFAILLRYGSRLPKETVYRIDGPARWLLRGAQAVGVVWGLWAVSEVGMRRLTGIDSLNAHLRGERLPKGPAAQGPERDGSGTLTTRGPFRWSRHPLNLAPLPAFWLTPHLTTRRLAFNVVATAYLLLGSMHEERRLARLYGCEYQAYRSSGVPFYWPRPARRRARGKTAG